MSFVLKNLGYSDEYIQDTKYRDGEQICAQEGRSLYGVTKKYYLPLWVLIYPNSLDFRAGIAYNTHSQRKNSMGLSSEEAKNMVGSRYDLVLIASQRVRELKRGTKPHIMVKNGPIITALKEIEQGFVGREYLDKLAKKR